MGSFTAMGSTTGLGQELKYLEGSGPWEHCSGWTDSGLTSFLVHAEPPPNILLPAELTSPQTGRVCAGWLAQALGCEHLSTRQTVKKHSSR